MSELGKRIAEQLSKRNMTQKELAKIIGVTEATMSRYVADGRTPNGEVVANIATALHTTSDYLLGIENDEFDFAKTSRVIARNARKMSNSQKQEIINALFGEDE